jgi:uncharacterized protein (UPF0147 family)
VVHCVATAREMTERFQQLNGDVLVQQNTHAYAAAAVSNLRTYSAKSSALRAASAVTVG